MENLKVIVADDHPGALQQLVSLLEAEFLVVATAENGQAALDYLPKNEMRRRNSVREGEA